MKSTPKRKDSLFTDRARGGVIGATGYNFQDAFVVVALPSWLRNPAFCSVIKEGFEDVDVRFEDATGTWTWHYQLKDHPVNASELRAVLTRFVEISSNSDLHARRFILGSAGLAPGVSSLWRRVQEYRGLRQTHTERSLGSTRAHLEEKIREMGLHDWSELIIERLEIDLDTLGFRNINTPALMERFRGRFIELPHFRGQPPGVLDRLFVQLAFRINNAIREGITRAEIEAIVESELASATKGPAAVVYLHGWARQQYELQPDEEIDWTRYFEHETLQVPRPEVWDTELLPELSALRRRLDKDGGRSIWLRARAPLSAGLAFGRTFAEGLGYSITVQQPSPGVSGGLQTWATDSVIGEARQLEIREVKGDAAADEVIVAIGITDDIRPKVEECQCQVGLGVRGALYLYPPGGSSPTSVNEGNVAWMATAIKQNMRRFADENRARLIHLFFFGPLGLAVLLGQKLNGLPDIQCYERDKMAGYGASCRLPG